MLFGSPCANPFPPHFLHHLQLVGLISWGANLLRDLLLLLPLGGDLYLPLPPIFDGEGDLLLGGDSYCPLDDREDVGDADDLAARLPLALRPPLAVRSLCCERSVALPLLEVAPMALSTSLVLYPSTANSCSLSVTMSATPVGAGAVVLSRCSSAAASNAIIASMDAASCLWS